MADARRAPLKDQTDISGARALIVEARFYDDIQDALLEGAVAELKAAGVTHDVITVPGALEIPAAIAIALDAAENGGKPYDAVIALGCVIRGDTIHFEIVSMESSRALMDLAVASEVSARQRHHHRQHRRAGLGAGARRRTQQGRRRRARGARDAADQAPAGAGLIMADDKNKPARSRTRRRQESQPPRRGAARGGAGAVSDGHRRRRDQRHLRRVREPLARRRGRRRQIPAGRSGVLSRRRRPAWCAIRPNSIP